MFKQKDLGNLTLLITSLGLLRPLPPHLALSRVAKSSSDPNFSHTKQNPFRVGIQNLPSQGTVPERLHIPAGECWLRGGCLFGK